MMIFPKSLRASEEVLGPIFVNFFMCIYIYIYILLHSVYMFQMVNVFSMSFTCLSMFIYNGPCLIYHHEWEICQSRM